MENTWIIKASPRGQARHAQEAQPHLGPTRTRKRLLWGATLGVAFLLGWTHAGLSLHAASDKTVTAPTPRPPATARPSPVVIGAAQVTDPCCGSVLRADQVSYVLETPTKRYYFDSRECLDTFYQKSRQQAEPEALTLPREVPSENPSQPTVQPTPAATRAATRSEANPTVAPEPIEKKSPSRVTTGRPAPQRVAPSSDEPPSVNEPYPDGHVPVPEE